MYAADRLTPGTDVTHAQVVEAGSLTVATSMARIARYSRELHDAFVERHGIETVGAAHGAAPRRTLWRYGKSPALEE